MGENCGGSAKDVVYQPENGVDQRAYACTGGLFLHDADGEEPNRNTGYEVEWRGHHNDRNGSETCYENAGEPHGKRLSLAVEEEAHDGLYYGKNNNAADRNASLDNILKRQR